MFIVDTVAKDVHYLIDLSMTELVQLKHILDNMEFTCDGSDLAVGADAFLHNELYPLIVDLLEGKPDGS